MFIREPELCWRAIPTIILIFSIVKSIKIEISCYKASASLGK